MLAVWIDAQGELLKDLRRERLCWGEKNKLETRKNGLASTVLYLPLSILASVERPFPTDQHTPDCLPQA